MVLACSWARLRVFSRIVGGRPPPTAAHPPQATVAGRAHAAARRRIASRPAQAAAAPQDLALPNMPPSPYAGAAVPGLDRAEFATATTVPALRIGKAHCHRLLSLLKGWVGLWAGIGAGSWGWGLMVGGEVAAGCRAVACRAAPPSSCGPVPPTPTPLPAHPRPDTSWTCPACPSSPAPPDDGDSRLLLLNKDAASVRAAAGPDAAAALDAAGAVDEEYVLERGYENLTADEVLKVRTEVGWTEVGWSRC